MKKLSSLVTVLIVLGVLARMCLYTVSEREYALVFALGELRTVVDTPGIHVKLPPPFQNVVYLDKRILNLDGVDSDLVQTGEKKNLLIDTFVKWRIEDPRLYWVSFQGNELAAENRLSALLRDVLNIVVNKRTVNQITSSEREKAMREISTMLQERVKDVGIGIVDVRMKRTLRRKFPSLFTVVWKQNVSVLLRKNAPRVTLRRNAFALRLTAKVK